MSCSDIDTATMREHYNAPANTGRATPDIEELCDEIDRLRARLAEVEAELASEAEAHRRSAAGRAAAEARLAEVEAERDIGIAEVEAQRDKALADLTEMTAGYTTQMETISGLLPRLREIEARLAEVEAALLQGGQTAQIRCNAALQMIAGVKREHAAAWRDEVRPNLGPVAGGTAGDRAEAEPVYPFGTPCRFAGTGCGEEYCTCAETVGHFCPLECVTCAGDRGGLGFSGLCPTCRGIGRHLDHCPSGVSTDPAPVRAGGNSVETPEPRPARGEGNQ